MLCEIDINGSNNAHQHIDTLLWSLSQNRLPVFGKSYCPFEFRPCHRRAMNVTDGATMTRDLSDAPEARNPCASPVPASFASPSAREVTSMEALSGVARDAPKPVEPILRSACDGLLAGLDPDVALRTATDRVRLAEFRI